MATYPDIDYARAADLLDTVQKVATIAPRYQNLGQLAMSELKDMDEAAKDYHDQVAKELQAKKAEDHATEQVRQDEEAKANAPKAIPASDFDPTPGSTTLIERRA